MIAASLIAAFVSCSSPSSPGSPIGYGGASGAGGSDPGTGAGGSGFSGTGSGATGGTLSIAGNAGNAGSGSLGDGAICDGVTQEAQNKIQPADIIFVVDNSGSMGFEAGFVQQNLDGFSRQISGSGIAVQVVLISSYPGQGNGICIGPPLGSGGCPTQDTNAPTFLHVNQEVDSHDALQQIISTYPQWRTSMRPGASKHFVVITDDNANLRAADFNTQLLALDPPTFQGYRMHAVFAPVDPISSCLTGDPCCLQSAAVGTEYQSLVQMTGGVAGNLCLQGPGFTDVFNAVATKVVQGSALACEWDIPASDAGALDPNKVNVIYTGGGNRRDLGKVGSANECANFKDAWYYDNPAAPTKIYVCPDICNELKGGLGVKIDIQFGCVSRPPIPA